ncbi:MAG TPA: hypothetical protein VNZ01_09240 [Solirubrobacteraceae bacterium]|jgi:hypothetical protein|nr:hypothetical protein [Solirubrobacteraceae bacterium]
MLTQLLVIALPLLWVTLTVLIVAACRAAARADAAAGRSEQSGALEREAGTINDPPVGAWAMEPWPLAPRGHPT